MTRPSVTRAQIEAGLNYPGGQSWSDDTVTYSLPKSTARWVRDYGNGEATDSDYGVFSAAQAAKFRQVMETWDSYVAIDFKQVSDTVQGDIRVAFTDVNQGGRTNVAAYAYVPPTPGFGEVAVHGDVWVDDSYAKASFARGTFEYELLLHEVGHAIGLKHSFEVPAIPERYDSTTYSVMSYMTEDYVYSFRRTSSGSITYDAAGTAALTPMVFDIAAIQKLYGADPRSHAGNDVYRFTDSVVRGRQAIDDAGGNDTLDLTGLSRASYVDLRPGAYSDLARYAIADQVDDLAARYGQGNRSFIREALSDHDFAAYDWTNNLGISHRSVIENVIGTRAGDSIYGNAADNKIDGAGGSDTMRGRDGDDHYRVNVSGDRVIESSGDGSDTIRASASYRLPDHVEKLVLTGKGEVDGTGNWSANTLIGNDAANTLNGAGGRDLLIGEGGRDVFKFSSTFGPASKADHIRDFSTVSDTIALDDALFRVLDQGKLPAYLFKDIGRAGAVVDTNDRVVYDSDTGILYYDANGSGQGMRGAIAVLDNHASLTASDIQIV